MTTSTDQNTSDVQVAVSAKPRTQSAVAKAASPTSQARPARKSKKEQLAAMIAKPDGARISVLVERLGWQPHTVRAALSGLRKQGHLVLASKSAKTGEAIYRLMRPAQTKHLTPPDEVAS
ncbi:DUF3489 domain-containing protein [Pararhizobium sp.]|uniref:DUF3489 domain-containing protein n=1 Tax=Pararhizobium sp. TaxID=1977563 RepID=UPI00271CCD3F|nr:DUF3489 domain-containing protein [Pararhizobium sp.]MDO9415564.1 DUF3489 domain-containing protein [Pararhizobium sp.]